MEAQAEGNISVAKEHTSKELEYTEKYITNLFCSESFNFDGKTYYVWELYYRMKPNDMRTSFCRRYGCRKRLGNATAVRRQSRPDF